MNNWDQYLADEPSEIDLGLQPAVIPSAQPEPVNWDKYAVKEDPSITSEAVRHTARAASRIGETIAGLPGGMINFTKGVGDWLENKVPLPDVLKGQPKATFVQRWGQQLVDKFPTSNELKQTMSDLTSGFVDPQNALEEFGDDLIELSALLYGDKSKAPTKARKILSNGLTAIGKAAGIKSSGQIAKHLGANERQQFGVEMGTMFLMNFIRGNMAEKYVGDKFKQARKSLPESHRIDTTSLDKNLARLEAELNRGISTATKNEVKGAVNEMRQKIASGSHPAGDVMDMVHDINERMSSKKLFDDLSKTEQVKLRNRYSSVKSLLKKDLAQLDKTHPEAYKLWLEGMEGRAVIENSNRATRFIEKNIGKLPPHLMTGIGIEMLHQSPQTAAVIAGGVGALKSYEIMNRIISSPVLLKAYTNAISAAASESLPAFTNELSKLDSGLQKSIKKDVLESNQSR